MSSLKPTSLETTQVIEVSSTIKPQNHMEKPLKRPHFLDKSSPELPPCADSGQTFICPYCHIQFLVNLKFDKIKDKK